jgi:hypothetical protein
MRPARPLSYVSYDASCCREMHCRDSLTSPMATFSAHTASPPPPSRTPAGSRAATRHTSIAPRTMSVRGPLAWDAPRTRTHRNGRPYRDRSNGGFFLSPPKPQYNLSPKCFDADDLRMIAPSVADDVARHPLRRRRTQKTTFSDDRQPLGRGFKQVGRDPRGPRFP